MTLYKPDPANNIKNDINGMKQNFEDLDPSVIVDEGSSAEGYYRVYASGVAEAWGIYEIVTALDEEVGAIYRQSAALNIAIPLPIEFDPNEIETYNMAIDPSSDLPFNTWIGTPSPHATMFSTSLRCRILSPVLREEGTYYIRFYIKGKKAI